MSVFPKGWQTARLREFVEINPPKDRVKPEPKSPMVFVPMASVAEEYGGMDVGRSRPFEEVCKGYVQFRERDVLFAKITPCMENGKVGVVPKLDSEVGYGSTEFHVLRVPAEVDPRWIAHFVSRQEFRRVAQRNMSGSAGQLRVPEAWLSEQSIPVAPPNEQQRVVAKLEELISDLEAGTSALKRARANLKRYRAAVLKAAVEGRLTEKWRTEHPGVEPAGKLLERILVERRKKWEEAQLRKYAEKGQAPPKEWKDKYVEPGKPDFASLSEIPKGWCWATTDQLLGYVTSGSRGWAKYCSNEGSLFLGMGNLDHDTVTIDLRDSRKVMPPNGTEGRRTRIEANDILVSITADVGMIGLAPDGLGASYINQHLALARCVLPETAKYVAWYLASEIGQRRLKGLQRGATKVGLGLDDVRSVSIPLPPLVEQTQLVASIDRFVSVIARTESEVDRWTIRSARLRESLLKRAFEGKLMPQDPKDEPVSEWLARIRAERAGSEEKSRRSGRRGGG